MRLSIPNLRMLRAFEAVGRLESISGAARAIHLSQPAVTQAIAKLESIVGDHLFDRRATGTYLTLDGVELHRNTVRLLTAIEAALSTVLGGQSAVEIQRVINRLTNSQLESVIAITEYGNSRIAAKQTETHESSLNRSAKDLERNIGARIIRRTASGIQPTDEGAAFAVAIARALSEFSGSMQSMFASRQHDLVCIGAPVLDNAGLLSAVINEFAAQVPGATIRLFNEPFESLRLRLRAGSLDLIVGVLKPHSPDLTSEVLLEDPFFVVGRRGHPLAKKTSVSRTDLARYDWIVPNRNAPRREVFEKLFADAESRPGANIEAHSLATITMTLASSDRLALLTASEANTESPSESLAVIRHPMRDACSRIAMTYLTDAVRSPHHDRLVGLFQKHAKRLENRLKTQQ